MQDQAAANNGTVHEIQPLDTLMQKIAEHKGCGSSGGAGKASCGSAAGQGDLPPEVWEKVKNHPCYSEEAHHHYARALGADWVLASVMENTVNKNPETVLMTLLQVIDIRGSLLSRESEKNADFVMRTQVGDISVADFDRCVEAGEDGLSEAFRRGDAARESLLIYAAPRLVGKL